MHSIFSRFDSSLKLFSVSIRQALALSKSYELVLKRMDASPGLPVDNATDSFWIDQPSPFAKHQPSHLPNYADVVIIGSGITGASIARTLVEESQGRLKIVMLEARDACSGATGRNGGHLKPPLYHDYHELKRRYGIVEAKKTIRFRLKQAIEVRAAAEAEGIVDKSQLRDVEGIDVYLSSKAFELAKQQLAIWKSEMPNESEDFAFLEGEEAIQRFGLARYTVGVIYSRAGAMHPYRFVTAILESLVHNYSEAFCLSTNTPVTAIKRPMRGRKNLFYIESEPSYIVKTPRGDIEALHVVHATNAWVSHLVDSFRTKIVPVRMHMTAQRPGTSLSMNSTLNGKRSWVFFDRNPGFDYLTQLPSSSNQEDEGELMFGGGFLSGVEGLDSLACADDSKYEVGTVAGLAGLLPLLFGDKNWGAESASKSDRNSTTTRWSSNRVKAAWSGIDGISADGAPWVGRIPLEITSRAGSEASSPSLSRIFSMASTPNSKSIPSSPEDDCKLCCEIVKVKTAPSGEWICAGYSGEGMAYAFLCGRALAYMILDRDREIAEWFPDSMRITMQRWKNAYIRNFVEELFA